MQTGPGAASGAVLSVVIFGSWVGFSAYIWLLNRVSTTKVSTYAYVNPVVAVFLGWLVLHEQSDRLHPGRRRDHHRRRLSSQRRQAQDAPEAAGLGDSSKSAAE